MTKPYQYKPENCPMTHFNNNKFVDAVCGLCGTVTPKKQEFK